jgi:tRNA threonylcarbamoyladenosine biosynthesis protein TsaB
MREAAVNLLGFNCFSNTLSVGILAGGSYYSSQAEGGQKHSLLIMELADSLMKTAGLKPKELNAVCCMRGPGSFTGLRIGFASAKGMCLPLGIPLISVPTLDCLAAAASWKGLVLPVIDAKQHSFFCALYRDGALLTPYLDSRPEQIRAVIGEYIQPGENLLLTGPDAEMLFPLPEASFTGRVFAADYGADSYTRQLLNLAKTGNMADNYDKGPLYIRKSDAEQRDESNNGR